MFRSLDNEPIEGQGKSDKVALIIRYSLSDRCNKTFETATEDICRVAEEAK